MNPMDPLLISIGKRPPARRAHARQRGVIMVVAILGLVLLASLVFYLFNVGRSVQRKIETQNAADAAAISGAGWTARSFNTVAMNNVEISRLISMVQVLDSVPMSVAFTLEDQIAALQATDAQISRLGNSEPWLGETLVEASERFQDHVSMLEQMNFVFNESGYDVAEMTFYEGPQGRGTLWGAMESLDALNEATLDNVDLVSQYSALRGAEANMRDETSNDGGLLLPYRRPYEWQRGEFNDFRDPVVDGLLPARLDDKITNRGPYDVLFGWRRFRFDREFADEDNPYVVDDDWDSPWGSGLSGGRRDASRTVLSYSTAGTHSVLRDLAGSVARRPPFDEPTDAGGPLHPSEYGTRVRAISNVKLNYLWEGSASSARVYDPRWITNYDQAVAIEEEGTPEIQWGYYLYAEFERFERNGVLTEPALINWTLLNREKRNGERLTIPPGGLDKPYEHIWFDQRISSNQDTLNSEGEPTERLIEWAYYVFIGINVGEEVEIRDPNNITFEEDLPAPMEFEPDTVTSEEASRFDKLTFAGVAWQPNRAPFWSAGFDADRPDRRHVAMAQAEVFNNHSWDLWTQMWHAQLTPIEDLDGWLNEMERFDAAQGMPWMEEESARDVAEYLRAVQPFADWTMAH